MNRRMTSDEARQLITDIDIGFYRVYTGIIRFHTVLPGGISSSRRMDAVIANLVTVNTTMDRLVKSDIGKSNLILTSALKDCLSRTTEQIELFKKKA